jgi:hypothetical protein
MRTTTMAVAVLCGSWAVAAHAADDDLTVVKRAVQRPEEARPMAARGGARWFRVRVDKRAGGKVRVNLPLPFTRALSGAETELRPLGFRLSEALGALGAGQEFVTIEGQDASVRVWID